MTERWMVFPQGDIPYMLSNKGRLIGKIKYDEGEVEECAVQLDESFSIPVNGKIQKYNTVIAIANLFGLPCEGMNCTSLKCDKCGFNPEVAEARKERIVNGEMRENELGCMTLFLNHDTGR